MEHHIKKNNEFQLLTTGNYNIEEREEDVKEATCKDLKLYKEKLNRQ
jgi:hypothetical protein